MHEIESRKCETVFSDLLCHAIRKSVNKLKMDNKATRLKKQQNELLSETEVSLINCRSYFHMEQCDNILYSRTS
jgi:hypothetical protein